MTGLAKPSRVLVTGGAGFLGCHLVRRLTDEGHDVTVLDDFSSPSPMARDLGVAVIEGSVIDPPRLQGPFDIICHLASPASPPRYMRDPIGTLRTGAEGTFQMLELAVEWGARMLFTSTSEVYGDPEVHPQHEAYAGAVDVHSPRACYDEGKRYAEALIYAYRRTGRLTESSVIRLFNTYGPGMAPNDGRVITAFIGAGLQGERLPIFGDGSQTRSFCYVDDVIDAVMLVLDKDIPGPVNIGDDREMTVLDLADAVEALLGDHGRQFFKLPDGDPKIRRPDLTAIRSATGWTGTTDLMDGLTRTIEYLKARV